MPSQNDIVTASGGTHYVFSTYDRKVYIYNSQGVQAIINCGNHLTPEENNNCYLLIGGHFDGFEDYAIEYPLSSEIWNTFFGSYTGKNRLGLQKYGTCVLNNKTFEIYTYSNPPKQYVYCLIRGYFYRYLTDYIYFPDYVDSSGIPPKGPPAFLDEGAFYKALIPMWVDD